MSRVLDITKYRANKDKDKKHLVYFIRLIHYKLVTYDKQCLPPGLEINLDIIPVIITGGSLNLPVTAEFMPVIVNP